MSYIRHYILEAKPGAADQLQRVLSDLKGAVVGLPGSEVSRFSSRTVSPGRFTS